MKQPGCVLCETVGGTLIISNEFLRVVLVDEPELPGYARVIWSGHVREMTELEPAHRRRLVETVCAVEAAQRAVLAPLKINLASFGNLTPHVHWHVIPRFADDSHFPQPVWGERQRDGRSAASARRPALGALARRIAEEVSRLPRST